jgi:hypothetical protein
VIALRLRPKPNQDDGGGHLIVQLFLAPTETQTFALCGEVTMGKMDWAELAVQRKLVNTTKPADVTQRLTFVGDM